MASWPSILPKDAPHFFKIIQPHVVREGRLRIPKMIVAKYGKDLPDRLYLKVPNGEVWVVNLSVSNGEVWMQDGWKEFAEHYSIGLYHFLVFRYEGNSHCHVLIFDKSASEIEYSSPKTVHKERTNLHAESKRMASDAEKERALKSAKAFTSENPFFMATMQPSYLKYNLTVPLGFMNRYFDMKDKSSVNFTLGVKDGRTWRVNFPTYSHKLTKGWTTFASDNYLEVGDVCVFEMIKGFKNFLNVVIFRARKDADC